MKLIKGVKNTILSASILALVANVGYAQNEYRSNSNDLYWKNRKPHAGYWQQDVAYKMDVKVDDDAETVSGTENLTYWNNSPDTLDKVYFHLYQNAFQPGSYLHDLRIAGDLITIFGPYEKEKKGTVITKLKSSNGVASQELINTILVIHLNQPILPGESATFNMDFTTYWDKGDAGNIRRRMKTFYHGEEFGREFKHFDGVHWYPRIAVYDRKFGWTTDQHLGKEFYGDYGSFDVNITFPAKYVVEATGKLVNRDEMLPADLRKALDISNFKTKRDIYTGITEDVKGPNGSDTKTWHFKAINVHDFAFTADPTYRIGEVMLDGVRCIALAQEANAHQWQPTAKFVSEVVAVYNKDFGKYAYPKIVAADARDGMEYPMITLNSGSWPGHKYVIAHEVGHNWFFGMIGNNETYRASLDEGFTQFLTAWSLKQINGMNANPNPLDDGVVFNSYIGHASDENIARLNVHSDHYNSAERHGGGYSQVYYKTASMLYNLQYVLGDELFTKAMKNYFSQWQICHPYWADFRTSVIQYTKVDLNWFFDEWLENTNFIDYEIVSTRKLSNGNYKIKLKRHGMQMPLDITVTDKDGNKHQFYVPNTLYEKENAGTVLPRWIGWGMLNETYETEISVPAGIQNVEIDESGRLADINRLNNRLRGNVSFKFDKGRPLPYDFRTYHLAARPDFWYNGVDGLKVGAYFKGGYFYRRHLVDGYVWYNTGVRASTDVDELADDQTGDPLPVNYWFNYRTRGKNMMDWVLQSRYIDGLQLNEAGFNKMFGSEKLEFRVRQMMRDNDRFVFHPELWDVDRHDVTLNATWNHPYNYKHGRGRIRLGVRSSAVLSDYSYSRASLEVTNYNNLGKLQLRTRTFAAIMSGSNINPASQLMLAGANEEEMMDVRLTQSWGIFPRTAFGYEGSIGMAQVAGVNSLNIRGNAGYRAVGDNETDTFAIHYGNRAIGVNAELDFSRLIFKYNNKIIRHLRPTAYVFGDVGVLGRGNNYSGIRADAGLGATINVRTEHPYVFRFEVPAVMSRVPETDDFVDFRFVFGINKIIN